MSSRISKVNQDKKEFKNSIKDALEIILKNINKVNKNVTYSSVSTRGKNIVIENITLPASYFFNDLNEDEKDEYIEGNLFFKRHTFGEANSLFLEVDDQIFPFNDASYQIKIIEHLLAADNEYEYL